MTTDTKTKIILAAIKVISTSPSAPMEEIAEAVNLNRRTLHRYFSGKEDLIKEIVAFASRTCLKKTIASIEISDNPNIQLKTMFEQDIECGYQFRFLYNFKSNQQGLEKESAEYKEMLAIIRGLLKTLYSSGVINPKLTIDWVEKLYFSTIDAAINQKTSMDESGDQITEMAWISYFNAIKNPDNQSN
ncbi:TetR/AcrR family transcriptional regulator [Marinigracilibium pacificum]|uniref:TetR/AcrR family transcriptional regulator n=1 Tax=Marinigracilibium pacificum TaxID=2729599 RepID=A0A848IVM1_9BACT|nr:TetR/AcrR family transcriptional regulator [Marinigracilibium pacificum]NMM47736.1 TetR/AcrR family transcriptional regulator [Marinigracilibium pacificum]